MRYLAEFSDPTLAQALLDQIAEATTRPWAIMEVCGGQTHSIIRHGIDQLLPERISLIHGPGCPVCVTPVGVLDAAMAIAADPDVVFCSFGDMLRVPGSTRDLFSARSEGADVRVVYSPLDAVRIAEGEPDRQVVFFAVGFETTAPANAMAVETARQRGLTNFSILVSHVLVPPAISTIADDDRSRIDAFLAAGHVCTVMGIEQYAPLVERHRTPIVVTGFEPIDILDGIRRAVMQLETGVARLENAYERAVVPQGNPAARALLGQVFETCDREWRGVGIIPDSGWQLTDAYRSFDALHRFSIDAVPQAGDETCRAGEVLRGLIAPPQCESFGTSCSPRHPLGAPMVSAEGACAAYYHYRTLQAVADD